MEKFKLREMPYEVNRLIDPITSSLSLHKDMAKRTQFAYYLGSMSKTIGRKEIPLGDLPEGIKIRQHQTISDRVVVECGTKYNPRHAEEFYTPTFILDKIKDSYGIEEEWEFDCKTQSRITRSSISEKLIDRLPSLSGEENLFLFDVKSGNRTAYKSRLLNMIGKLSNPRHIARNYCVLKGIVKSSTDKRLASLRSTLMTFAVLTDTKGYVPLQKVIKPLFIDCKEDWQMISEHIKFEHLDNSISINLRRVKDFEGTIHTIAI